MLKKKQSPELIQPFYLRKRLLIDFLEEFHPFLEFSVVELKEPCGPTKTEDFEGMFCTKETLKGADYINNIRKELGLKELAVFTTSLVQSKEEDKISSGDIRNEILKKIDKNNEKFVIEYLKSNWFNEIEGLFKGSNIDQALVKDLSEYWLDKLMGCYLEKWREYHTVMHIYELLRLLDEMKGEINKRINVFLAIWFHDAVYWADDNKNEEV